MIVKSSTKTLNYGDALKDDSDTEFLCIFNADGSFDPKELDLMIKED